MLLQLLKLSTYLLRLITDSYSVQYWVFYRIESDVSNYLIGLISIILLAQWYQSYQVLADPLHAINRLEKNWAFVSQIILCILLTVFVILDIVTVSLDA